MFRKPRQRKIAMQRRMDYRRANLRGRGKPACGEQDSARDKLTPK
jgi:hypothetical protein